MLRLVVSILVGVLTLLGTATAGCLDIGADAGGPSGSGADRLGGGRVTRRGGGVVPGGAPRNGKAQRNPQDRDDDTPRGITHWLNPSHCLRLQVSKTWSDG
jgi:hypothetical protein